MRPTFSFKKEAIWMMIFSLGLPAVGLLVLFVVWFLRSWSR
jgi:hypothetical protein